MDEKIATFRDIEIENVNYIIVKIQFCLKIPKKYRLHGFFKRKKKFFY